MKTDFLKKVLIILLFVFLASFLIRQVSSLTQDLGRHLKFGEIILETKNVSKANLFSYTEPEQPFINSHWLSEVIFYIIFRIFSFPGLIIFAAIFITASFIFLFFTAYKKDFFWLSFLVPLFFVTILLERTDVRPEVFSFLIFSFYIFILFRELKKEKTSALLWVFPVLQVFWVNLHIYFFLGPIFYFFFFLENIFRHKTSFASFLKSSEFKKLFIIAILIITALFFNPNGISGAFYPVKVMGEYGYSIIENQTPFFLFPLNYHRFALISFFLALTALILSSFLNIIEIWRKKKIFNFSGAVFASFFGAYAVRNFPIFVFIAAPIIVENISDIYQQIKSELKDNFIEGFSQKNQVQENFKEAGNLKIAEAFFAIIMILVLIFSIYNNSKKISFEIPSGAKKAVDFIIENKIAGKMFNNYDIGSYLIWRLYPEKQVFVDNRPEAYSVEFLQSIYIPMQESEERWKEYSQKYDFNFVIFEITDITPWARVFLSRIGNNPNWPMVYLDERAAVFVKKNPANQALIDKYALK